MNIDQPPVGHPLPRKESAPPILTDALDGNLAITGEIDLSKGMEFTLGIGFGDTPHIAASRCVAHSRLPFASLGFVR